MGAISCVADKIYASGFDGTAGYPITFMRDFFA